MKKFDEEYLKLLSEYQLDEGFFDLLKAVGKGVANKAKDIGHHIFVSPFKQAWKGLAPEVYSGKSEKETQYKFSNDALINLKNVAENKLSSLRFPSKESKNLLSMGNVSINQNELRSPRKAEKILVSSKTGRSDEQSLAIARQISTYPNLDKMLPESKDLKDIEKELKTILKQSYDIADQSQQLNIIKKILIVYCLS